MRVLLCCLLLLLPAGAQSRLLARIEVKEEGLYLLSFAELHRHVDLAGLRPRDLGLWLDGRPVPIEVRGARDGRLDPADGIVFYAPPPRGRHSHVTPLFLGVSGRPRRLHVDQRPLHAEASDFARVRLVLEEDLIHQPRATVRQDVVRAGPPADPWVWKRLAPPPAGKVVGVPADTMVSVTLPPDPEPVASAPATLRLHVVGPVTEGIPQRLEVSVNNRLIATPEWNSALDHTLEMRIPHRVLRRTNVLLLRNRTPVPTFDEPDNEVGRHRTNALYLDSVELVMEAMLVGPSERGQQITYLLPPPLRGGTRHHVFSPMQRSGFLVYDVERGTFNASFGVDTLPDRDRRVICASSDALKRVTAVHPVQRTRAHLAGPGGDLLVVTTSRLRPYLTRFLEHKQRLGLTPVVVEARACYDTFSHGRFDPGAIRSFVRAAARNWKTKPRYLLLVGDADRDVDWISTKETLPALMVMTDYNGVTASDALYGDLDDDGLPELAVGRLPMRTRDELFDVLERIIRLEQSPPSGEWRRRMEFVAGEGRFGPAVDKLLEGAMRRVLQSSIRPEYRVAVTWANPASPFYWPARTFSEEVIRRFNAGSLAFTYVGHGSFRALDHLQEGGRVFPILDHRHTDLINAGHQNPVLSLIACWTGAFDRPEKDCIAELLLRKSGGPVAVIASTRISHPYPDALLGRALAEEFQVPGRRLGDVLLAAQRRMCAAARGGPLALMARPFLSRALDPERLVADHVHLYNLLGDPSFRAPLPGSSLTVDAPASLRPGAELQVTVSSAQAALGSTTVSLERPTGSLPWKKVPRIDPSDPRAELLLRQRHRAANDPVVVEATLQPEGRELRASLIVPPGIRDGSYLIRVYATGAAAAAARPIKVTAPASRPAGDG